jgi:rhodanese-related sulfurtransferase
MNAFKAALTAALFAATTATAQERVIGTAELVKRMDGPPSSWSFTLVDARTAVEFSEAHIPGAINVAASKTSRRLPELLKDRSRTVVFYCNGPNCTKTVKAAKAAKSAGYTDVLEYKEGIPGWGKAGRKMEGRPLPAFAARPLAPAALKGLLAGPNPPLVVDIRDAAEYEDFHVPDSISLPIDDLEARLADLPAGRPVVLADHAGHQAPVAGRLLASLGRKDVSRLDGGVLKWQAAGLPLARGK